MNMKEQEDRIPIPELFYSFLKGGPFSHCLFCKRELLASGAHYVIEKALNRGETIVEYAACIACCRKRVSELSVASLKRIRDYFDSHVDLDERSERLCAGRDNDVSRWLESCILSGRELSNLNEYQLVAECRGDQLCLGSRPFLISGQAIDEILTLLSEETRRTHDDWIDRYFGLPPELKKRPLVLV